MNNCNDIVDMSKNKNFWLVEMLPFTFKDRGNYKFVKEYQELSSENGIFGIGWSDYPELKEIFGKIPIEKNELTKEVYEKIKENIKNCPKLQDLKFEGERNNIEDIYQKVWKELEKQKEEENNNTNKKNNEQPNDEQENSEQGNSKQENEGLKSAIKKFFSIEKGDIVLSRLRNGKYIVGIVEKNIKYYGTDEEEKDEKKEADLIKKWKEKENEKERIMSNGFGWRCKVKRWYTISREDVPSDIIGRCSQRNSSTITRINNNRLKLFILKLLKQCGDTIEIDCPPIILNKNNFATSLNSDELEDLVYLHILSKEDKNLTLLPSLCKISEPLYEFFLQDEDGKYITCQVKNKSIIEFLIYEDEMDKDKEKKIKKIYLFSGIGKYFKDVDKEKYDKSKNKYKEKIIEIDKKELWETLDNKKQYFKFSQEQMKNYYCIKSDSTEKENNIFFPQEITDNDWKMHISRKQKKGKKTFNIKYYNDDGEILNSSKEIKNNCDNNFGIEREKVYEIIFMYYKNEKEIEFCYNNEFKCFIIKNPESELKNIIEEVRPIVEKIIGEK